MSDNTSSLNTLTHDELDLVSVDDTVLSDANETLLRHIRPEWIDNGVPSSQNFKPMPKDCGKLSVERGALIAAECSYQRWVGWGRQSVAVFGVTADTFLTSSAPIFASPVVCDKGMHNPEHALVHYPSSGGEVKKLATKAKLAASLLYEPDSAQVREPR